MPPQFTIRNTMSVVLRSQIAEIAAISNNVVNKEETCAYVGLVDTTIDLVVFLQ